MSRCFSAVCVLLREVAVLASFFVGFVGCTEYVDINLNKVKPRLVVDGELTTNITGNFIRLTTTADFFSNQQTPKVDGAKVTVSDGFETVVLHQQDEFPGYYFFPNGFAGLVGQSYHLVVELNGNHAGLEGRYEARATMPAMLQVDSIGCLYDKDDKRWRVLYYGQDHPDVKDYYMFMVAKNDSLVSDQYSEMMVFDDELFNGSRFNGVWVQSIREENNSGKPMVTLKNGDWIVLYVCGITRPCFEYLSALSTETGFKNPVFGGPPANLRGNISNGALGFFNTYSVVSSKVQVKVNSSRKSSE